LAALAEAMYILNQASLELPGDILITIHGQHEDAVGDNPLHAPLFALFDKHIVGEATIVCEGPHNGLVIAGKGLSFWEIDITRQGDPLHEVTSGGAANPLWAAYRILQFLEDQAKIWEQDPDPDVGPQTFFVGEITGGDYFNRIPTRVHMKGTRRTIPGVSFNNMSDDFHLLVNRVAEDMNLDINLRLIQSGQSYRLSPDEPVVRAVRDAYTAIHNTSLPLIGLKYTGNASQFNNIAKVPAVYFGADQSRAHATPEWIDIDKLQTAARVYLLSALNYFDYTARD
jgi:acetylornithine deacetylase/succinyl-diaminopimelate desuccinylase-like protein